MGVKVWRAKYSVVQVGLAGRTLWKPRVSLSLLSDCSEDEGVVVLGLALDA